MTTETTTTETTGTTAQAADTSAAASTDTTSTESPNQGADDATKTDTAASADAQQQDDGKGTDGSDKEGQGSESEKKDGEEKPDDKKDEEKANDVQAYDPNEIKLSEGFTLDKGLLEKATPTLRRLNASTEDVQELAQHVQEAISSQVRAASEASEEQVTKWHDETVKQFGQGGEAAFMQRAEAAQKVLSNFLAPEELDFLSKSGAGNMPGLFKLVTAVAEATKEDTTGASQTNQGKGGKPTLAEALYGNPKQ